MEEQIKAVEEDVSGVLEIFGENHKRAEAAAQRRAVSQGGEGQ